MWKLTLRGLRHRPGRFIATVLAVVVGTAFLATALILRDSVSASLQANTDQGYAGVQAAVQPDTQAAERRFVQDPKVPASLLPTVQRTAGVGSAAGTLTAGITFLDGTQTGTVGTGLTPPEQAKGSLYIQPEALNPYRLASGAFPGRAGEVAIDRQSAEQRNLSVGSSVALATTAGRQEATVSGIVSYGAKPASTDYGDVIVSAADGFAWLGSGAEDYQFILTTAAEGTSVDQLVANLQGAVGSTYQVKSGDDFREEQSGGAAQLASTVGTALQVFAYVALFVGIFIIYNTFTVSVTQRLREFALLRAVGAAGKQVRRAVLVESLVLGLLASALGFAAGIVLVVLLTKIAPDLISLGSGADVGLSISPAVFVQVVLSGLIVTVVSAFIPAFRAARVRPIEALRESTIDRTSASRFRMIAGAVLCALGTVLTLVGAFGALGLVLAAGPPLLFLGILVAGPAIATGFSRLVAPVARLFGRAVGRVASDNAARNPRRTATTANALLVGVFLVVFVTAAGGAIRDWGTQQISQFGGPDLTLVSNGPMPPQLVREVPKTPGVEATAPVYYNQGRADLPTRNESNVGPRSDTGGLPVAAIDFAQTDTLGVKVTYGKTTLADDEIAVVDLIAGTNKMSLGDPVTVTFPDGKTKQFKLGAEFQLSFFVPPVVIPASAALAENPTATPSALGVKVAPGQVQQVQSSLEDVVKSYSNVAVVAGNSIATFFRAFFDALISAVNALLLVAVVIAVFGIVNTLMLSIIERTHEIGLLRAVGMTRGQLWGSVQIESMIVSLLGVIVGIATGLFVAWTVTLSLFRNEETGSRAAFSWPVREMVLIALLGVAIGVIASLLPAIRAMRMNALEAIRSE